MSERASKDTILNIPVPTSSANRSSMATPTSSMATPTAPASEASEDQDQTSEADECEDGIGEFDDGRSGKITLGVLIQDGIIEAGDGVMAVDYLGQTFKGDLMLNGKIKSQETGLVFNNPSAWAIYCKKIVNPSKKSGCGERKWIRFKPNSCVLLKVACSLFGSLFYFYPIFLLRFSFASPDQSRVPREPTGETNLS